MNTKRHTSDSELARAIANSPFHREMLMHEDSSIARYGVEFEHLADAVAELNRELVDAVAGDDDEGPTELYQRVGTNNWFRN